MIGYEQALAVCRTDPEAAARLLCEFSRELDQLKAEVATLKAENTALRRDCQSLRDELQALKEKVAKNSHNSSKPPSSVKGFSLCMASSQLGDRGNTIAVFIPFYYHIEFSGHL